MKKLCKILAGKAEGKRPFRRSRSWYEDIIRMDLRVMGWESMDWIHQFQDRDRRQAFMNTVMNLGVRLRYGKFLHKLNDY